MLLFQYCCCESREYYNVLRNATDLNSDIGSICCKTLLYYNNKYHWCSADEMLEITLYMESLGILPGVFEPLRFVREIIHPYFDRYVVNRGGIMVGEVHCRTWKFGIDKYESYTMGEVRQIAQFMSTMRYAVKDKVDWKGDGF